MQEAAAQESAPPGERNDHRPTFHDATMLLQDFLRLSDQFARRLSGELDVNATDYRAMEHLLRAGPLAPGELARRLGITSAAVTTSVDRLVSRGHVTREPDPADRRRIRVIPAQASAERASGIVSPMVRALDAELDGFTTAEQDAITEYLRRVVETMRAHSSGEAGGAGDAGGARDAGDAPGVKHTH
ncbi:MarR family winged helix-turn-helix transcriptional regulator [Microbacteriaceae bacterium 4G12]